MYIVIRPYRDFGGMRLAGSIVEPGRGFRVRLQDKHIVELTEQNFDQYANYLKGRHGVTINRDILTVTTKEVLVDTPEATPEEAPVATPEEAPPEPEKVKAVKAKTPTVKE